MNAAVHEPTEGRPWERVRRGTPLLGSLPTGLADSLGSLTVNQSVGLFQAALASKLALEKIFGATYCFV